jgi:hypothetical protein
LRPEFCDRGLATEGGLAAARYGFECLELQEIVAFTMPANKRSRRRVMEQIGLVFSEEFNHPLTAEGHAMRRQVLYRISRSAWEAGPSDKQESMRVVGNPQRFLENCFTSPLAVAFLWTPGAFFPV